MVRASAYTYPLSIRPVTLSADLSLNAYVVDANGVKRAFAPAMWTPQCHPSIVEGRCAIGKFECIDHVAMP
jgi:hypothetical protein